jgi:hypothetical protein
MLPSILHATILLGSDKTVLATSLYKIHDQGLVKWLRAFEWKHHEGYYSRSGDDEYAPFVDWLFANEFDTDGVLMRYTTEEKRKWDAQLKKYSPSESIWMQELLSIHIWVDGI